MARQRHQARGRTAAVEGEAGDRGARRFEQASLGAADWVGADEGEQLETQMGVLLPRFLQYHRALLHRPFDSWKHTVEVQRGFRDKFKRRLALLRMQRLTVAFARWVEDWAEAASVERANFGSHAMQRAEELRRRQQEQEKLWEEWGDAEEQRKKDAEVCRFFLENILQDALCLLKVWSAQGLNWSIVTRAHAPRQIARIRRTALANQQLRERRKKEMQAYRAAAVAAEVRRNPSHSRTRRPTRRP